MKKALTITLVAALALVATGTAYANYCSRDAVPASTILLPFARQAWDFDTSKPTAGWLTQLVITNVSEDAQIIHITVWSPESEALIDFDEVLSGYDMWQISSVDLLSNQPVNFGTSLKTDAPVNIDIPNHGRGGPSNPPTLIRKPWAWGPDGPTSFDQDSIISEPHVTYSVNTANCFLAPDNYQKFPTFNFDKLINGLEGAMIDHQHGGCNAQAIGGGGPARQLTIRSDYIDNDPDKGDGTWTTDIELLDELWYYLTVDVVNFCNVDFPSTTGYFDGVSGGPNPHPPTYKWVNVLLGDMFLLNSTEGAKFSDVNKAVHIEGRGSVGAEFYGEKTSDTTGLEPLGTAFAAHYRNGLGITSNLIVWKNHTELLTSSPYKVNDCGSYLYYAWDMDEHTLSREVAGCPVSPCEETEGYDPNEFPLETQLVPITTDNFDLPDIAGWMLFVFNPSYPIGAAPFNDPTLQYANDPLFDDWQVFALVQYIWGDFSGMLETAEMGNYHCDEGDVLPQLNMADFTTE
jgi:hypothetical protein